MLLQREGADFKFKVMFNRSERAPERNNLGSDSFVHSAGIVLTFWEGHLHPAASPFHPLHKKYTSNVIQGLKGAGEKFYFESDLKNTRCDFFFMNKCIQ